MSNTYQKKSRRAQPDPMPADVAVPGQVIVSMAEIAESAEKMLAGLSSRRYEHGLEPAGAAVQDAAC